MATLLYVKASPKRVEDSASLQVAEAFLQAYREKRPEDEIRVFDVFLNDFPDFDYPVMEAEMKLLDGRVLTPAETELIARRRAVLEEFMAADRYLFACPVWDLGIPARLKAYFDAVVVVEKTFHYDAEGKLHGLLEPLGRKAVCVQASGNFYDPADPLSADGTVFLRSVLNFIGVWDVGFITAEGTGFMPVPEAVERAREKIPQMAEWFLK